MMLQKLMDVVTLDIDMSNKPGDFETEYARWQKMQTQIQSLIQKQQDVNDLLITAKVLAQEQLAKLPNSSFYISWTNIFCMLNDIKLDSFLSKKILNNLKDLLWYYKESQKHSFIDLETAKYWFDFLQRLELIYTKQENICIELSERACEANDIYPFGPNNTPLETAGFWYPISQKLQECN